ncbi:MAG: hypothetical protein Kow00108_06320 [Calditrichia bacterium]
MKFFKAIILILFVFLIACSSKINFLSAISGENLEIPEFTRDENGNLLGTFKKSTLFEEFPMFKQYCDNYQPDQVAVEELKKYERQVAILIVLGTWCSDSERFVGEFFKIQGVMDKGFDVLLIGIDRDKTYPEEIIKKFNIERVPTFVVFRDGSEIGRIIETPMMNIEQDLLSIVTK